MSDFGEIPAEAEKDIGTKIFPNNKIDLWRDIKIMVVEEKALELSWAKSVTGRRIDFPREDGKLVWGTEIVIPLLFDGVIKDIYMDLLGQLSKEKGFHFSDQEILEMAQKNKKNRMAKTIIS